MSSRAGLISRLIAMAIAPLLISVSCDRFEGGGTTPSPNGAPPVAGIVASTPLGQIAGSPGSVAALATPNPWEGNAQAIAQGRQLYLRMNCAGCHAYDGAGNMGPDLTDTYWRYGGLPIQIYKTIQDGRPEGMPAWGKALPADDIWKLVAWIESLGGTVAVKDYATARQGDQPGEQTAPEAQAQVDLPAAGAKTPEPGPARP
jgi:cytochrome c oxidase cbb3-type subunit 3